MRSNFSQAGRPQLQKPEILALGFSASERQPGQKQDQPAGMAAQRGIGMGLTSIVMMAGVLLPAARSASPSLPGQPNQTDLASRARSQSRTLWRSRRKMG